ncbi:ATP-binding protein [Oceaniglobus ichthyenteri]|uniref:ATP-binding protein n=1 Tax=Oceaniglobus ichthyenteri TaxID=2136177 RepID=UPI000D340C99|nr:ATP-binding protein [Oceaniglobus ichthyenteri]
MTELNAGDLSNLAILQALAAPIWIFDLDRHSMWWANAAGLTFWKADSLADLKARDFSSDSTTVRRRLRQIAWLAERDQMTSQTWTLYPGEEPVTVALHYQPIKIEDGRDAMLIEIIKTHDTGPDAASVRLRETMRYSGVMLSMYSMSGTLLVQNAPAFDCYGGSPGNDAIIERLGSQESAIDLLGAIAQSHVFDAEIEVATLAGKRMHRVRAHRGRDPITGEVVAVVSEDDISDIIRLRNELSGLNSDLERRVSERNESLRISEERFSLAMRGANDGLWDHDFETGETYLSPRWLEMLGYDEKSGADLDQPTILARVHPEDRAQVEQEMLHAPPDESVTREIEFRIRHKLGHWVDVLSRAFVVVRDGKVARMVGTHVDISERKRHERALRRLKEILFEGSAALPLALAYYNQDFRLVMHNTRYKDMLPRSAHILVPGVRFEDILRNAAPEIAAELGYDNPEDFIQDRLQSARVAPRTWIHSQPDGRIVKATEVPTSGNGVISLIEDITEERARQKLLQQAQKMEAIGQLTGGVAHDFNNLLAVIMGNLELLQLEAETGVLNMEDANSFIGAAIQAVKHGADLTNSMLAYARKARLAPSVLDPNQTVRETERWMRRTIPSNIEIETVLQAGIWPIRVDQSSLQSTLVNLIVNARDAMENGGKLTIETANLRIDDTYLETRSETISVGRYVMVAVSDTGDGIAPDVIEQIYDPFFTTKTVGKGTGLGLSMVEGFVKQSGGTIRVYSEPGKGTSFKLYFKAEMPGESPQPAIARKRAKTPGGKDSRARILLAEDKPEVMMVLERTLLAAGYDIVSASTGDIAFAQFQADPDFDLVVTDIVMPGRLQGPDLARECRDLRPDTPFIFLSGYASEATVHGNGLLPDDIRLMKPVSRADLLRAVEKCLSLEKGQT